MWVMEYRLRPAFRSRIDDQHTSQLLRTMWIMVATGLTAFLGGVLIWNLDNWYCSEIRRFRRTIGLPWAVLFEGHAWWHLMTGLGKLKLQCFRKEIRQWLIQLGLGAYYYIAWGIWLRHCLSGQEQQFVLHWPSILTSVPRVIQVTGLHQSLNGENATVGTFYQYKAKDE